ncbi:MAG: addiction module component [Algoriphagus sp. 32-45-6]|nr:MAG: addiction module component [Algoriphagus sp. 32-45-6]
MDAAALKLDLIKWLTQLQDEVVLKKIHALKEADEKEIGLSADQIEELERRLEKYHRGDMEFSSWESVKERIKATEKNEG